MKIYWELDLLIEDDGEPIALNKNNIKNLIGAIDLPAGITIKILDIRNVTEEL